MKRDFALIKNILLEIEKSSSIGNWVTLNFEEYSDVEIIYHVKLLNQAGLIEADDLSSFSGDKWAAKSLTWQGHDFLDNARNETIWKKTLAIVKEKGGSVSFNIFQNLLQSQASKLFEGL